MPSKIIKLSPLLLLASILASCTNLKKYESYIDRNPLQLESVDNAAIVVDIRDEYKLYYFGFMDIGNFDISFNSAPPRSENILNLFRLAYASSGIEILDAKEFWANDSVDNTRPFFSNTADQMLEKDKRRMRTASLREIDYLIYIENRDDFSIDKPDLSLPAFFANRYKEGRLTIKQNLTASIYSVNRNKAHIPNMAIIEEMEVGPILLGKEKIEVPRLKEIDSTTYHELVDCTDRLALNALTGKLSTISQKLNAPSPAHIPQKCIDNVKASKKVKRVIR